MASFLFRGFSDQSSLADVMADVAIKVTVILICALLVTAALRRASAATRHCVWCVTMVAVLALPLLNVLLPRWGLPIGWMCSATGAGGSETLSGRLAGGSDSRVSPLSPESPEALDAMLTQSPSAKRKVSGAPAIEFPSTRSAAVETRAPGPATKRWDVAKWLLAAWILGSVVVVAVQMRGLVGMWLLCRRAHTVVEPGWTTLAREVAQAMHLRRPVRFLTSDRVEIPMVWGFMRPAVLLPKAAHLWPAPRFRAVLLHEFSHLRRNDLLARHVAGVACAVYWWHPLVWMAARRLHLEGEKACDDCVLEHGVRASEYASHLLQIAHVLSARTAILCSVAPIAQRSQLRARVVAILGTRNRRPVRRVDALAILALATVLFVPLATASLSVSAETISPALRQDGSQDQVASEKSKPDALGATSLDRYGDPIPAGATAVLGTFRLRHSGWHKEIAFSPDGKKLLSTTAFGFRVWKTATGELLWDYTREATFTRRPFQRARVSNDGSVVCLAGPRDARFGNIKYSIVLLRAAGGRLESPLELEEPEAGQSSCLCFSPDGTRLFVGHGSGAIHVWDVHQAKLVQKCQLAGNRGGMSALEVSPDGKLLAVVFDSVLYVWPWRSGGEPSRLNLEGFRGRARGLAFSADGKRIAIGQGDPTGIRVWDLKSGRLLETLEGPHMGIYKGGFAFTAAGVRLAIPGIVDTKVSVWDMSSGRLTRQFKTDPFQPERAAISPDGQWIAAVPRIASRIWVWHIETGAEVAERAIGHEDAVRDLDFSPDGRTIVTASDDGTVRTWRTDRCLQEHVLRHDYIVRGVAVSPDGKWIASNSGDDSVRLWDAASGKEIQRFPGHGRRKGGLRPVAFRHDGRRIHTWGDGDMKLRVWDQKGNMIHEWEVPPADVREQHMPPVGTRRSRAETVPYLLPSTDTALAKFSPDGNLFVLVLRLGVYVFEVETGKQVQMIAAQGMLRSAAVAPDGTTLAVAEDRAGASATVISLYALTSGREIWEHNLPDKGPSVVSFSPDGKLLVAATKRRGGKIQLLDAGTGKPLHTIGPIPAQLSGLSLRFSPDGKALSCGTAEGAVLVWSLPRQLHLRFSGEKPAKPE
ncbi:MAG: hypothetical protein GXP27_16840 [Planctomycetes bacterium]|nr:hypothetical protein [Planctomycetota bacterium]